MLDAPHYEHQIDSTNAATLARTCEEVADKARQESAKFAEEASDLRSRAAALQQKEGMQESAAVLLREAGLRDELSENRAGIAAAYSEHASQAQSQVA